MKKLLAVLAVFALGFASCGSNNQAKDKAGEGETILESPAYDGEEATYDGEEAADAVAKPAEKKKKGRTKLKTEADSISYAIGVDLGNYLKSVPDVIGDDYYKHKMILAGINDILDEKESIIHADAYNFMRDYFTVRVPERNYEEGNKFLEEVSKLPNVQTSDSGLRYEIIEEGTGIKPSDNKDQVRVLYRGSFANGKVFDDAYEHSDTLKLSLNRVMEGWREGLKYIGEGGKIKLWIPSDMAFGPRGSGPVGANTPVVYEFELFEVIPYVDPEENVEQ